MFDVLIREANARFGLGENAAALLKMLLAHMTQKEEGGLVGFIGKFKAAGLGPVVQSWLGGGPAAQHISNEQVQAVLGGAAADGVLPQIVARLGTDRESTASAVGYLLPAIVGMLTPGGSLPSALPPEVQALAAEGSALLAAPAAFAPPAAGAAAAGGMMKLLPWAAVALAALLGLAFCSKGRDASQSEPAASATAPAAAPAEPIPPASDVASGAASDAVAAAASDAVPAADAASAAASAAFADAQGVGGDAGVDVGGERSALDAANAAASGATPVAVAAAAVADGAMVEALLVQDKPAVKVYFETGKADVHADFAAKAADLLAYLKDKAASKAVVSGFNDPRGNAAANAELSKNRAQAVKAALESLGVAADRIVLEKPAEATATASGGNAELRRVEVLVRD